MVSAASYVAQPQPAQGARPDIFEAHRSRHALRRGELVSANARAGSGGELALLSGFGNALLEGSSGGPGAPDTSLSGSRALLKLSQLRAGFSLPVTKTPGGPGSPGARAERFMRLPRPGSPS